MEFINIGLIKNPVNWFTILLMLIIFGLFADLVLKHYSDLLATFNPPGSKSVAG